MMKKKEIFRKIGGIITEITEQYQYLSEDPENLNELELELFIANANFLSDHIIILKKLEDHPLKDSHVLSEFKLNEIESSHIVQSNLEESGIEVSENVVSENVGERGKISAEHLLHKTENTGNEIFEFENKPIEQLLDQSLTLDELQSLNDKADPQEEKAKEVEKSFVKETKDLNSSEPVVKEITQSERTIAIPLENLSDLTITTAPTINELLSEKSSQNTLANQFSQQPVKDLKSIINLNDKLLFVKDLFKGYSLAYSEAIEFLNRCESFKTADDFLRTNYASKNNWLEKEATVEKFYEILNRRFVK